MEKQKFCATFRSDVTTVKLLVAGGRLLRSKTHENVDLVKELGFRNRIFTICVVATHWEFHLVQNRATVGHIER